MKTSELTGAALDWAVDMVEGHIRPDGDYYCGQNWRELEEELKRAVPLMRCGNRTEFQQRLQWLSEGMLRNHLEHITNYQIDQQEIEQYLVYKEKRDAI